MYGLSTGFHSMSMEMSVGQLSPSWNIALIKKTETGSAWKVRTDEECIQSLIN